MIQPILLEAINAMDEDAFTAALGFVFELSPWVVRRAWAARPFDDRETLYAAMIDALNAASSDEKLALIRAHPELAGKAAIAKAAHARRIRALPRPERRLSR
jgi:2-oxo-4-hydroxy-4-carboxy-5-ureidoimidazoline decarboxylase